MLRSVGLLPIAERIRFLVDLLRHYRTNMDFSERHPGFSFPPAAVAHDAYATTSLEFYFTSGMASARMVLDLVRRYAGARRINICEWGCGPGRIIRHFPQLADSSAVEVSGTDYKVRTIQWLTRCIPGIRFYHNNIDPPLPFESDTFDCLYSVSVFTHLSENSNYNWLEENLRVVKPGGVVVMTVQGDNYREKLLPDEKRIYDSGRIVVRGNLMEGSRLYSTFHSPAFMRSRFLQGLEILHHDPNPPQFLAGGQDIWVLRKH